MAVGSNVNPNYPIPGLDQSSKGFRDNFATIKQEIEALQGTTIQLAGGVVSEPYQIGSGTSSLVIDTQINGAYVLLAPPNRAIQYNINGLLTGSDTFIYSPGSGTVGIGTVAPDPNAKLDVAGEIKAGNTVIVTQNTIDASSNLILRSSGIDAVFSNNGSNIVIGSDNPISVEFVSNGINHVSIKNNGNVGIGTASPSAALHVESRTNDVAKFHGTLSLTDNTVRATTDATNSTIGYGLEHRLGDTLGGMRINQAGLLSLHTGESMDADLSTSTARLVIDKVGRVGIGVSAPVYALEINGTFRSLGITDASVGIDKIVGINNPNPFYTLDIMGDVSRTAALVSNPHGYTVDTSPQLIDSWSISEFRSARYRVQIVNGNPPSEQVDMIEYGVTHANGVAYGWIINSYSTGASLGSLSVAVVAGFIELTYTGNAAGNRIKLDTQLTII